jgi:hypothetical protein
MAVDNDTFSDTFLIEVKPQFVARSKETATVE